MGASFALSPIIFFQRMLVKAIFEKKYILSFCTLLLISLYACSYLLDPGNNNKFEPEMIYIDEDLTFTNGPSWDSTIYDIVDSLPIVTLDPYYISKYELTNLEYFQFVKEGGYSDSSFWSDEGWKTINDSGWTAPKYWGNGDKPWENDPFSSRPTTPVHAISYYEAEAYCQWQSVKTGMNYYVPYRLQWVRAAKGPDPGTKYTWGNDFDESKAYYTFFDLHLVDVTSYPEGKSHDGCYHMIGNVYEICYRIPDEWVDFALIYSFWNGTCSVLKCMKETMTTTSGESICKHTRRNAVGLRICRD